MVATSRRGFAKLSAWLLAALRLPRSASAATDLLRSAPYLQHIGSSRASILWATRGAADADVQFRTAKGNWQKAEVKRTELQSKVTGIAEPFFRYRADLLSLTPGEVYTYRVTVGGRDVTPAGSTFRTDDGTPFRFLAFGDSGMGTVEQLLLAKKINAEKTDIVLPLGDLAYPMSTFVALEQNYFDVYGPLMSRAPFFAAPGNHDYYFKEGAAFIDGHSTPTDDIPKGDGGRYYSFDWGPVHFVVLDSNTPLENFADGDDRMAAWLVRDLTRTRKFWRIAYFHHPPYASGVTEYAIQSDRVRRYLVPIFEKYGVQFVMSGHEHSYQRTKPMLEGKPSSEPSGIVYVTSGGGGAYLYKHTVREHMEKGGIDWHYLSAEVDQSRLKVRSIPLESATDLDSFTVAPKPYLRSAIVNSASQTPAFAVGGLISIYGRNLSLQESMRPRMDATEVGGTKLTLNGKSIRFVYASPDQINALIPLDAAAGEGELVLTTPNGSVTSKIPVAEAAPAIFLDPRGALVLHDDGSFVSENRPMQASEQLSIYATGLGTNLDNVFVSFGRFTQKAYQVRLTDLPGVYLISTFAPWEITDSQLAVSVRSGSATSNVVTLAAVITPREPAVVDRVVTN